MAIVFPLRFHTTDPSRRDAIMHALRAHGAGIHPGPVEDVHEARLEAEDPLPTVHRCLVAALDCDTPGWRHDLTLYAGH